MAKIGLVSCVSRKQTQIAAAQEIYISDLFQKSRAYVERHCDRWYILSAKHGLLNPQTQIEPYDITLNNMRARDRREWAKHVLGGIVQKTSAHDTLIFLAGMKYREHLIQPLLDRGYAIEVPMMGLPIGKQLQWLNNHLGG
jgi:hypothetical protein